MVALVLCPLVRRMSAIGREAEEEEDVGVKRASYPPLPYLYRGMVVVGVVVVFHYPDRFCGRSRRGGTEWGGGSCNRATRQ
jgi:hypothetical protein